MKHIIVCGTDRVGKGTLIKGLTDTAENYTVRHFGYPKGNTDDEKMIFQHSFFKREFKISTNRNTLLEINNSDLLIWDRSHIGENVYGVLYRQTNPEQWVFQLEEEFGIDKDPEVYLVLLVAPAEFICKRDDGESFTSDIVKKQIEIDLFIKAFTESKIQNKLLLNVSDGENYISKDELLESVLRFIKQ